MNDIISRPQRVHTHDPSNILTRIGQFHALAPDQAEAGMTWLAARHPVIFDAAISAARIWDDGQFSEATAF